MTIDGPGQMTEKTGDLGYTTSSSSYGGEKNMMMKVTIVCRRKLLNIHVNDIIIIILL